MKPRIVLPLVLAALMILPDLLLGQAKPDRTQASIAFIDVTVIDVAGGASRRDTTVVITTDRISAIGDSAKLRCRQMRRWLTPSANS